MQHYTAFKALFFKELHMRVYSPVLYVAVSVLYLASALPFVGSGYWFSAGLSDFRSFFLNLPFLFCIIIPLLAMNSWTDEKKYGTDRLLASYPVGTVLLACAKYAALLVCVAGTATLVLCIPLSVVPLVYFDFSPFFLSYCAVLFFGAALSAWALALSNICPHAAISFLLTFFTGLFFTAPHVLSYVFPLPLWVVKTLRYLSFTLHFESAARGIFDTRDFFFYALSIIAAQGLAVFLLRIQKGGAMGTQHTAVQGIKKEEHLQAILLGAVIVLAALLSLRLYVRIDMTKEKTYSLSSYTVSVLKSLEETVSITWFRSHAIDGYLPALQYVEDILTEYERASHGKCLVKYQDTTAFSKERLHMLGIAAKQIEKRSDSERTVQNLYSGLLCEYRGEYRVIPFLSDIYTLEADIARFIIEMKEDAQGRRADRSLYIALPEGGKEGDYRYVVPWLEYSGFVPIMLTKPYPELRPDIPLLVIGSSYFDSDMLARVDTFVNRSGSAVFFVSAHTVDVKRTWHAEPKRTDGLIALLARSGFDIRQNMVMDAANFRLRVPTSDASTYTYRNYPLWPQVFFQEPDTIAPLVPAGKHIQFFWPSELVCTAARGKTPFPFLVSGVRSALQHPPYATDPQKELFTAAREEERASYPLAAASEHTVNEASGIRTQDAARLLVVADEYCVSSAVEYTSSDANLDFMVNALHWITRQDSLLQLKNKAPRVLPFRYFESDAAFTRVVTVSRIFNLLLIPVAIIVAGVILITLRRRKVL